ncbi:hypothetical protein DPEC_G00233980 [Dallia pectoralis]|uniref:Uncharacterized protein n=1 Tax=Dallia pectoralis TaxID=75939 RepID=A0ACC2FY40_DALPE|nr:hypothetical protein DPEC_G00233980 [Dallia pectoralis]
MLDNCTSSSSQNAFLSASSSSWDPIVVGGAVHVSAQMFLLCLCKGDSRPGSQHCRSPTQAVEKHMDSSLSGLSQKTDIPVFVTPLYLLGQTHFTEHRPSLNPLPWRFHSPPLQLPLHWP